MITLGEDILNRAWRRWNERPTAGYRAPLYYQPSYSQVTRRSISAMQFEDMLFKEGAIVQRINKRCYLQFTDPEEALLFRLRHA